MDPIPSPPDFTQPCEAPSEATSKERARIILTPDPSVGTGCILPGSPADMSPANVQAIWDAIATIQGYSFNAEYATPSEEQEPAFAPPKHVKPPPGYPGLSAGWSPSTLDGPIREATMMYSAPPAHCPPTITWTTAWPYKDAFADPITIEVAREPLVRLFKVSSAFGPLALPIMDMPGWLNEKTIGRHAPV